MLTGCRPDGPTGLTSAPADASADGRYAPLGRGPDDVETRHDIRER